MPMTWNAEADAKLFAAVMQVADVKLTGDALKKVADIMGDGCTPKALTHRIAKFKTLLAKSGAGGDDGAAEKTATPAKGKGKGGKAAATAKKADTPVDGGEDEEVVAAAKSKKAAGGKRKKAESAADGEKGEDAGGKKVKVEEEDAAEDEF